MSPHTAHRARPRPEVTDGHARARPPTLARPHRRGRRHPVPRGLLGRSVEVTVRPGGQHVSLVAPRADTSGLRPDDPVRLTVRPENLLLFEADGPQVQDD
ncbi:hypothetical protein [Streptomyces guryensis]|uniref:TOBE domain-containing protein n=1 Tax=Streptomyces guryensis TaxID=2886947 RepID=A0A9Q3VJS7_9ACTN|nr:hypothetical protein [Streptomyces guryensis]MCD9872331.1 hypothetical protein [Streptomyces guryensis]